VQREKTRERTRKRGKEREREREGKRGKERERKRTWKLNKFGTTTSFSLRMFIISDTELTTKITSYQFC